MTPAFASKKGGKRYRFYACVNALKRGRQICPSRYVPALTIESVVIAQIRELAKSKHASSGTDDELAPFRDQSAWEALPVAEQARLVQRLVQQIEYDGREGKVGHHFPPSGQPEFERPTNSSSKGQPAMTLPTTVECDLHLLGRSRQGVFPIPQETSRVPRLSRPHFGSRHKRRV
jgi:hypothetical protein